jgi:hypothetical protein
MAEGHERVVQIDKSGDDLATGSANAGDSDV